MPSRLGGIAFVAGLLVSALACSASLRAQTVTDLHKSAGCSVASAHEIAGSISRPMMTLKNDGGWCWTDFYARSGTNYLAADAYALTSPPAHGRVVMGDVDNHRVRTAYQPAPGFEGSDSFTVHIKGAEITREYSVTVSK